MSEDNKKFKICLPEEGSVSSFVMDLLKEDAEKLSNEENIEEGSIHIKTSYVCEVDDKIEVGFYIRNNTNQKVNFERIPLRLVKNDEIICTRVFEKKELGDTEPKSIKFIIVYFDKNNIKDQDLTDAEIKFGTETELKAKPTVSVEIVNLPTSIKKKELKHIYEYVDKLPYLNKNTLDINVYTVFYDDKGDLDIVIIIRNGCSSEAKVEKLPLKVFSSNNILIYAGLFEPKNIIVKGDTAMVYNILIPEENVPIKNANLSKYKVEFK